MSPATEAYKKNCFFPQAVSLLRGVKVRPVSSANTLSTKTVQHVATSPRSAPGPSPDVGERSRSCGRPDPDGVTSGARPVTT